MHMQSIRIVAVGDQRSEFGSRVRTCDPFGISPGMAAGMPIPSYAWEAEDHVWEREPGRSGFDDSDNEPEPHPEGHGAGDILVEFLMSLHLDGKLSAKSLCTIGFWSSRAGALGSIKDYAHNPGDPSTGHFMRRIEAASGVKLSDMAKTMYHSKVPGLAKYDLSRTTHKMPITLPHESLGKEIQTHPEIFDKVLDK